MQADSIIEKAKKLGLDTGNSVNQIDNLRTIAAQVRVDDLSELNEKLDSMLNEKLNSMLNKNNNEQGNVEYLDNKSVNNVKLNQNGYNEANNEQGSVEYLDDKNVNNGNENNNRDNQNNFGQNEYNEANNKQDNVEYFDDNVNDGNENNNGNNQSNFGQNGYNNANNKQGSVEASDDKNINNVNENNNRNNHNKFGQKEYNDAKNEQGIYDKNYYANREKELAEKEEKAKEEKNKDTKNIEKKNEQGEKTNTQKNKNVFDKAKDNANLLKAKNDRFQNKLSGAKAKVYNAMHPGEALKDKAVAATKETAKKAGTAVANAGKEAGKAAGKAMGKAAVAGGKALVSFVISNPIVLVVVGALLLLIIIIVLLAGLAGSDDSGNYTGLYGYEYVEPKCTEITISGGEYAGVYDLEEYIAGVTHGEFGSFVNDNWGEAAKAGAIAARSFVQANVGDNCTVISSERFQVYKTPNDASIAITEATRGLVLTNSSKIVSTQYDAFCTDSPQDDPDNYIVCQQNQLVPRDWVEPLIGVHIKSEWTTGTMSGAHGNGMSAWGAAYLSEQGYTFNEILEYYYGEFEVKSIYQSFILANNWTQEISTNVASSIETTILNEPLNDLLSKNEYNTLNETLYSSVMSAGYGTREAIVAAAVTPIKYLAENYNVVIPYALGGGHYMNIIRSSDNANIQKTTTNYYGIDPDWGTPINHTYSKTRYYNYGPDCSSWVPWVYHNAGINIGQRLAGDFVQLGTKHSMNSDYIARPGDLLENDGHVTVIVGVDEENDKYYIAHASGGQYGTIITPVSFSSTDYYIVDMSEYIENNINENYETDYMNGVLEY